MNHRAERPECKWVKELELLMELLLVKKKKKNSKCSSEIIKNLSLLFSLPCYKYSSACRISDASDHSRTSRSQASGYILNFHKHPFSSVQSLSRVQLFATPWIAARQASLHHQLPEFTQTLVHQVGDAIQPSLPLSSPSPPAPNPSQHQSLFQWVNSSHEVAKVLEFQL